MEGDCPLLHAAHQTPAELFRGPKEQDWLNRRGGGWAWGPDKGGSVTVATKLARFVRKAY